jgi:hypothetical protein
MNIKDEIKRVRYTPQQGGQAVESFHRRVLPFPALDALDFANVYGHFAQV